MKQRYKIGAWFIGLCAFSHVYNVVGDRLEAVPADGDVPVPVVESRERPLYRSAADAVPIQLALAADTAVARTMSLTLDGVMRWRYVLEPVRFLPGADHTEPACGGTQATDWQCVHIGYSEAQWRRVWAAATPGPFSFINFSLDWLGLQPVRMFDQAFASFNDRQRSQPARPASGKADKPDTQNVAPVPVPPAVWLFGSALGGLITLARRRVHTDAA